MTMTDVTARESQKERIRRHLERGGRLTQDEAKKRFSCARLGARIEKLRREGMDIRTDFVRVVGGDGHVAHVARYVLERDAKRSPEPVEGRSPETVVAAAPAVPPGQLF